MTAKKTIIHLAVSPGLAARDFWRARLSEHFDFVAINPGDDISSYNKDDCLLWASHLEDDWYTPWVKRRYKLIYDKLWDHFGKAQVTQQNVLTLLSDNFIFVNESLRYKWTGIDKIEINRDNPDKLFLCLMNAKRPHRDHIYERIKQYHNDALISYIAEGVTIPGDIEHTANSAWHSYVNPEWYNRTYFSLVVETSAHTVGHMSEKMFKPFAFKQPFVVWGAPDSLFNVKRLGFETFSFIFNELYDNPFARYVPQEPLLDDYYFRLNQVVAVVEQWHTALKRNEIRSELIENSRMKEVLAHNHNLFYSEELLTRLIRTEIIEPVLEFADA